MTNAVAINQSYMATWSFVYLSQIILWPASNFIFTKILVMIMFLSILYVFLTMCPCIRLFCLSGRIDEK